MGKCNTLKILLRRGGVNPSPLDLSEKDNKVLS